MSTDLSNNKVSLPRNNAIARPQKNASNISNTIKDGLNTIKGVDSANIQVSTANSTVNLNGKVPNSNDEILIEDLARQTKGVSQVNNNLKVDRSI